MRPFWGLAPRRSCVSLLFLAALVFLQPIAFGQADKGSIAGQVTDAGGGVLQGAQISVEPGGSTAVSNAQGRFFITGLNPGSYTVLIKYLGFADFAKSLEVKAGETALADALGRLPSVTIERDEGEGKYVQVRGTEPRLTNTTIDGINVPSPESGVRQIKFDAIPADIVESVEINKTLQANMDGDGIGGSINLVTKPASERPTVSLSGMGGYTPIINGRGVVETTGTIGQRFGSSKKFGVLIGGSYDWNGRGIDDIEPVADRATNLPGQPLYFDSIDIREYQYYRSRWGLAGSADYKLGDGSDVYIRGL